MLLRFLVYIKFPKEPCLCGYLVRIGRSFLVTMKALLMIPMMVLFLASASAQTTEKKATEATAAKEEMELKEHVCSEACAEGKHAYKCGEKGHKCSEDCAHMHGKEGAMKKHVCTEACANGKHAYACGEKGHQCSAECMEQHKAGKHKGHDHKHEHKGENKEKK